MPLLKQSLDYVRQYGLLRLLNKAADRLYRTVRPLLYSAGLIKDNTDSKSGGLRCFYVPLSPPRLNLVMSVKDADDHIADRIMSLTLNLADRTGYGLRILSGQAFDTLNFSRWLKKNGLRTGNVEFVSFASADSNSELDIGPLDVFIVSAPAAANPIVDIVNAGNIINITEQASQTDSSDLMDKLLHQITQVITRQSSGVPHVRP